jgi:hypothetical protein
MAREIVTSENKKQYDAKKLGIKSEDSITSDPARHKLIHIPLSHIEHGESNLPGGKMRGPKAKDLIKEYANRETPLPPIEVVSNDEGDSMPWMIADGSHRFEAAKLRKMTHIPAYVSKHDKQGLELAKKYKAPPKD